MRWSFRVARVAGIDVYIHITFLMIVAIYGWSAYQFGAQYNEGVAYAAHSVAFTLLLFFCILLHEFGHAFAARVFGIRTPDITLLPIGGVAQLERIPRSPWQEFVIAVAGPAVNVVIAIGLYIGLHPQISFNEFTHIDPTGRDMFVELMKVNILLVAFNMIPAFPMDGGRVLRSLLASQMDYATATKAAARTGQVIAVLFVVLGFWGDSVLGYIQPYCSEGVMLVLGGFVGSPMLAFIALFVFMGAQQELTYAMYHSAIEGLTVEEVMTTQFETVPETLRVAEASDLLLRSAQEAFPMVDESLKLHSLISREELLNAQKTLPSQAFVSSMARKIPSVTPDMALTDAIESMRRLQEPILPVVNASEQIVGLIGVAEVNEVRRHDSESA